MRLDFGDIDNRLQKSVWHLGIAGGSNIVGAGTQMTVAACEPRKCQVPGPHSDGICHEILAYRADRLEEEFDALMRQYPLSNCAAQQCHRHKRATREMRERQRTAFSAQIDQCEGA